jgi:hypothetical protein
VQIHVRCVYHSLDVVLYIDFRDEIGGCTKNAAG